MRKRRVGYIAVLICLLVISLAQARMRTSLLGGHTNSGGAVSWASWDESSEATLQTANRLVIFGEGGNATNETGQGGGLTGADLVWTQNGAVAGTGTYRTFDGTDDWMDATTGFRDLLKNQSTYGIIFKLKDWDQSALTETLIRWGTEDILIRETGGALQVYLQNTQLGGANTTDTMPTSGVLYVYVGCNGADARFGFSTTRPTKWSDFAAAKRISHGGSITLSTMTAADPEIFREAGNTDTSRYFSGMFYYAVWAKGETLIDFDS